MQLEYLGQDECLACVCEEYTNRLTQDATIEHLVNHPDLMHKMLNRWCSFGRYY